jgi:hypothetical protein
MMRCLLRALFRAGLAVTLLQGCAASSGPPPHHVVRAEYYYGPSPFLYERYVVYYDVSGRPVYFVAGSWHRVPVHYRHYELMVRDYHQHRDEYRNRSYEPRRRPPPPSRVHRERAPRRAE